MHDVVYFIRCGDHIKIGTTTDLVLRFDVIAREHRPIACDIIGTILGGRMLEQAIHRELTSFREAGEWFQADAIVEHAIADLLRKRKGLHGDDAFLLTKGRPCVRVSGVDEAAFVEVCSTALEELINRKKPDGRGTGRCLRAISDETGIPHGSLWALRYRRPRFVPAGLHAELLRAVARLAGEGASALTPAEQDDAP